MDRDLTLKYLLHLDEVLNRLCQKIDLSRDDIAALDRELMLFRDKAHSAEHLGEATRALISGLKVQVDLSFVAGVKRSWWSYASAPLAFGVMNRARRAEEQEAIRRELDRLHSQIRELHYAAQF